jgi:hypothetical protein
MTPTTTANEIAQLHIADQEGIEGAADRANELAAARSDGGGCPNCGAPTQVEGGCPTCTQCPWSKCGGGY